MSNRFEDFVSLHLGLSDPVDTADLKPVTIRLTPSQIGRLGFLSNELHITRQALMHEMICQGIDDVFSAILDHAADDHTREILIESFRQAGSKELDQ